MGGMIAGRGPRYSLCLRLLAAAFLAQLHDAPDGPKQQLVAQRFLQYRHGPRPEGPSPDCLIAIPGNENHGGVVGALNQGFQDLTGQTLSKVIDFIEALQFQLVELLKRHMDGKTPDKEAASDEPPQAAPAEKPRPASQDEVDQLLTDLGF